MKLIFEEIETTGAPFVLSGAVDTIIQIIRRHDGRLWVAIVCAVITELMKVVDHDPDLVVDAISDALDDANGFVNNDI